MPSDYYPTSSGAGQITITSAGTDARTDGNLGTVYGGKHSARVNDEINNYSVATIRQQVDDYTDNAITFAYAAVLQDSHDAFDSDAFIITLED